MYYYSISEFDQRPNYHTFSETFRVVVSQSQCGVVPAVPPAAAIEHYRNTHYPKPGSIA